MTLICPVLTLISMFEMIYKSIAFQNIDIKFNTGQISVILSYYNFTYILFIIISRTCNRMLKFPWNSDKLFDIVFMLMTSLSILWIRSVSAAWGNPTGHEIQFQGMGVCLIIFVKDLN